MKKKRFNEKGQYKISLKKGVKRNKLSGGILIIGIILLLILLILILYSVGFFDKPKTEQLFLVRDECSLVMGNVIHNLRNDGDCHIRCRNECTIRDMDFVRASFTEKNNSCHACDCYCR
jgi:hypothetical protein